MSKKATSYERNCFAMFEGYKKLAQILAFNQRRPLTESELSKLWADICQQ